MPDPLKLAGCRAAVIGAGQGIGRAVALALADAGARLALIDERGDRAEAVAREVEAAGGEAVPWAADVADPEQAEGAVEAAFGTLGGLDCAVNIVGAASWAPLVDLDEETWRRDFRVNLDQHWYVARAAARRWLAGESPGSLVVVASVSGVFAAPRHAAYGAAKAGLLSLVRSMSEEWWPQVRANAVVPGAVRTPRIEAGWASGEVPRPDESVVDRMAEPEDVAGAALFLCSGLARRITGQALVVDGGTSARFPYALS